MSEVLNIGLPEFMAFEDWPPAEPFFLDINMYDVPPTCIAAIKNLPDKCVGLSMSDEHGQRHIDAINQAAKEKGIFIQWKSEYRLAKAKEYQAAIDEAFSVFD